MKIKHEADYFKVTT